MKPKLLILHGAMQSSVPFENLKNSLSNSFEIYCPDLPSHGFSYDEIKPFDIKSLADFTENYIEKNGLENCFVFGYSMGGFIALYLQYQKPVFTKILTLATKFDWDENIAQKEANMFNAEKIKLKIPAFASYLSSLHKDWEVLTNYTKEMMIDLGKNQYFKTMDLGAISGVKRITLGDKDTMVSLEETIETYRNLNDSSLHIFPNTPHPFEKVNLEMISQEFKDFFLS